MESDIVIVKFKNGNEVGRTEPVAHAIGHPGVSDWIEGIVDDICNAITSQAFLSIIGGVVGMILPPAEILVRYQQAKELASQAESIINSMFRNSDKQYQASALITLDETDEFDEILLSYHAHSDDDIKDFRHITGGTWAETARRMPELDIRIDGYSKQNDKSCFCGVYIKTATLEDGLYPFIGCAVDKGSPVAGFDVLTLSSLTLNWRKTPKANATSLRQLSESIDPPSSSRSLREMSNILDIDPPSLRRCCEEQANCRSIQVLQPPLQIFEQNTALFPQHLAEIEVIPGVVQVPVFALYEGTNRQAAIESFIAYLKAEQPDIVGLCEVWVPEERTYLRSCLSEIAAFYAEGPIGGAPGYTTIMDGGLLLLSKWPIMDRDQIIYTACQSEDCFSTKGALYAGICVPGYPFGLWTRSRLNRDKHHVKKG